VTLCSSEMGYLTINSCRQHLSFVLTVTCSLAKSVEMISTTSVSMTIVSVQSIAVTASDDCRHGALLTLFTSLLLTATQAHIRPAHCRLVVSQCGLIARLVVSDEPQSWS